MSKKLITYVCAGFIFSGQTLFAAEQITAVGSSTVYPFITTIAENFASKTSNNAPIIESTGTGGGFKLFCSGVGEDTPDLSNASRQIKQGEIDLCKANGVNKIQEVKIGYDGIVLANSSKSEKFSLTLNQLFLALALEVPKNGKLVPNFYQTWDQIDKNLPKTKIQVYGPPPTSGTRDAFSELVLEAVCENIKEFQIAYPDKKLLKHNCMRVREDGVFIEAGENDNLIIQKLLANKNSLGVFGYSYLSQNLGKVQGSSIDSFDPTFENIASGKYPISRSLFIYVKEEHYEEKSSLKDFVKELVSEDALGQDGYLSYKGLIPLAEDEFEEMRNRVLAGL